MEPSKTTFLLVFIGCFHLTLQQNSFPLTLIRTSAPKANPDPKTTASLLPSSPPFNSRLPSKYSVALIASLQIGTPPQTVQMVLDTGSQLSWISCNRAPNKTVPHPTSPFYTSLSSTFSDIPCQRSICPINENTLGPICDAHSRCSYSYFYADGTSAEGNFVKEKFTFSTSRNTPPLIIGCTSKPDSTGADGILGMNLGTLSFVSQLKLQTFSYCVPVGNKIHIPTGTLYLGPNPNSRSFKYVGLLRFSMNQRMPNFDPLAYSVPWAAIRVGGRRIVVPAIDAGGSGQTMIDSGTQYTYVVDVVYRAVKEQVLRLAGRKWKKGYVYEELELCFDGDSREVGNMVGDLVFEFGNNREVVDVWIPKERVLDDVGRGVSCFAIASSDSLGGAGSNIIGNYHQQNHWVEFDLKNGRVGFGNTSDCNKLV